MKRPSVELAVLEAQHFELLVEITAVARRLALITRLAETSALLLADARDSALGRALNDSMARENGPKPRARRGARGRSE